MAKGWSLYLQTVLGYLFDGGVETTAEGAGLTVDWGALLLVITAIKVAIVLFVILLGVFYIKAANYSPYIPPPGAESSGSGVNQSLFSLLAGGSSSTFGLFGLLAGASLVFFAFIGFDVVATTAEEARDPQRTVPRGILGSLAIVTVLYVAVAFVVTGMVKYTNLATTTTPSGAPDRKTLATAFAANDIDWEANIISIGALAGLTTVVLVLMLGQIRVLFAMSRDGLMPPLPRAHRPARHPVRLHPGLGRGDRAPPLAILACLWLMLNLTVLTWLRFVIWMVVGVVVYFAYSRRHSLLGQRMADRPH